MMSRSALGGVATGLLAAVSISFALLAKPHFPPLQRFPVRSVVPGDVIAEISGNDPVGQEYAVSGSYTYHDALPGDVARDTNNWGGGVFTIKAHPNCAAVTRIADRLILMGYAWTERTICTCIAMGSATSRYHVRATLRGKSGFSSSQAQLITCLQVLMDQRRSLHAFPRSCA